VPSGQYWRIDTSANLQQWESLVTLRSSGLLSHTDSAAAYFDQRFYRASEVTGTNILTGDHLPTAEGDVVIHQSITLRLS
jgi:hypothetical protein